jgi:hypothetical protein
LGAF